VNYQALSASELTTRLDLHIKTAQDFLELLTELGIVTREEVLEKTVPITTIFLTKPAMGCSNREVGIHRRGNQQFISNLVVDQASRIFIRICP